ncbi:hypothetical protein [Oceanicaulis sp.]|uniref:hypothetical protein n=1 Tax=Oceanicaulis sp. TaxID=1924941 RepID=UPI003BAD08BA
MLHALIAALASSPPVETAHQVRLTLPPQQSRNRFIVDYEIGTEGLDQMRLRDMTSHDPQCPQTHYELLDIENAHSLSPTSDDPRIVATLAPLSEAPIRIRYAVSQTDLALTPSAPCNWLIAREKSLYLDGRSLFLAPRPVDAEGRPYRLGETRVSIDFPASQSAPSVTSAESVAPNVWRQERFNALLFGHILSLETQHQGSGLTVRVLGDALSSGRALALEQALKSASGFFETWLHVPAPRQYHVILLSADQGGFGEYIGEARPDTQTLILTPGVSDAALERFTLHELAHHWDLSRFRDLPAEEDLTWLREGYVEFLAHLALVETGRASQDVLITRANRALANRATGWAPEILPDDEGYLFWFSLFEHSADMEAFFSFVSRLTARSNTPLTANELRALALEYGLTEAGIELGQPPNCVSADGRVYVQTVRSWPAYADGLEFDPEVHGLVLSAEPESPAELSGLQAGEQLLRIVSGGYGDIQQPLTLEIAGNPVRTVSFMPHDPSSTENFAQYLPDTSRASNQCD